MNNVSHRPINYFEEYCIYWGKYRGDMLRHLQDRDCPVCSKNDYTHYFYSQDGYEFVRCNSCGMVYVPKIITMRDWNQFYHVLPEISQLENSRLESRQCHDVAGSDRTRFLGYFNSVEPYLGKLQGKRYLDVGTFYGDALVIAQEQGMIAHGIEGKRQVADFASKQLRRPVQFGFSEQVADLHANKSMDVVSALEILEHAESPRRSLESIWEVLDTDGVLVLSVPNAENLEIRLLKEWCFHLLGGVVITGHVNMFSKRTLTELLGQCGFEVLEIYSQFSSNLENIFHFQNNSQDQLYCYKNITEAKKLNRAPVSDDVLHVMNSIGPAIGDWENQLCAGPVLVAVARKSQSAMRPAVL